MIYIATPISEKPEKAGSYQLIENSGSIGGIINMYDPEKFGDTNGGWFLYITKNYKFWLKPVEGVVMGDIKLLMDKLSDDERMELMGNYCKNCGDKNPNCQCWNDE